MLISIHPENPPQRLIHQVVEELRRGGVVIYPTDTVYAMGCDLMNKKSIERLCQLKGISPKEFMYTIICEDVTQALEYAGRVENGTFKLLKRALPGPYTFVLPAGRQLPHFTQTPRKTIGVRVVDNPIITEVVRQLGNPIITTSLKHDDDVLEYRTDPELIAERFGRQVDIVVDGGYGGNIASTVLDLTDDDNAVLIREGLGDLGSLQIEWEDGTTD